MKNNNKESIESKTKESLIWNTILPSLLQIFRFAISIVIARILNPKDFGIMGIATIIIFYTNGLSNFGLSTALVQKKEISNEHLYSVFTINLLFSTILFLLTCLISEQLAIFFKVLELKEVFIALSSIFLITAFYYMPVTLLRRELNFKLVSQIEFVRGFFQSSITLLLAYLGFQYWALVCGLIASNLIGTLIINYKVRWIPKVKFNNDALKEIFSFASWSFLSSQIRFLNIYIDKLIIGKFIGVTPLGFYEKAFSIAFMPVENIADRVGGVMFVAFSRNQSDKQMLQEYLTKIIVTLSVLSFPIFVGLIAVAHSFVVVLLGSKWEPMIIPFQILLLAFMFGALTNMFNVLNIGAGNYKRQIKLRILCLILLIVLCLWSTQYGIVMIAVSVLIYNFVFMIVSYQLVLVNLDISWRLFINGIFPALTGVIIMFGIVKIFSLYIVSQVNLINLLILSALGGIIYVSWMFIIDFEQSRFLRNEVIVRINKMRLRFQ